MRNQSVQEGAHSEETMWTVLNFAKLVEVTAVTTLHHQFNIGKYILLIHVVCYAPPGVLEHMFKVRLLIWTCVISLFRAAICASV